MAIKFINGFELYNGSPLKMINQFNTETGLNSLRKPVTGYNFAHNKDSAVIQVLSINSWAAMMLKKTNGVAVELAMRIRYISRDVVSMGWSTSLLFSNTDQPSNSVNLQINLPDSGSSSLTLSLTKVIANVVTTLASSSITATEVVTSTTDFLLRLRKEGNVFKAKAWLDGTSEPSTWLQSTVTEAVGFNNGGILLAGGAQHVIIKSVAIADAGETAPLSIIGGNRNVAGPLKKPDDTIASGYLVRLYHKDSGVMLGEQFTDANGLYSFSIPVLESELVQIVGVDNIGEVWKPPIHETYPIL